MPIYSPKSIRDVDPKSKFELAKSLPPNKQYSPEVRYDGKTVIITGAGAGLGRAYALMYAKLGANVVVNGIREKGPNAVVAEIKKAGGKAIAVICSVEDGETIVKAALDAFGSVHVLVANAGVLRDKSFGTMTEEDWDVVLAVHLRGTYKVRLFWTICSFQVDVMLQCAKAVWPIFQKQKYGRILTTCSLVGLCKFLLPTRSLMLV